MAEVPNTLAELELALVDLGTHLIYPPTPDMSQSVGSRLHSSAAHPRARRIKHPQRLQGIAMAALVAAVLGAAVLSASPAARAAVGQWLGLPGVRVTLGGPVLHAGRLGGGLRLGRRTTLATARNLVTFHVLIPNLRRPDEVYVDSSPRGGSISLVYRAGPGFPQTRQSGVGLLVTEFQGTQGQVWLGKMVGWRSMPQNVLVGANAGYWIQGGHLTFRYYHRAGIEEPLWNTARRAGNTLLWERDGLTLRLESALTRAAAIRVATSLR